MVSSVAPGLRFKYPFPVNYPGLIIKILSVQIDNLLNKVEEYDQGEKAFRMLYIGIDCFVKGNENINREKNEN